MLCHCKVTQVLPETVLSFIQKISTELLLLAGTVPGAGDLTVNVAGQFSARMKLTFQPVKGLIQNGQCLRRGQVSLRKPKLRSGQVGGWD